MEYRHEIEQTKLRQQQELVNLETKLGTQYSQLITETNGKFTGSDQKMAEVQ